MSPLTPQPVFIPLPGSVPAGQRRARILFWLRRYRRLLWCLAVVLCLIGVVDRVRADVGADHVQVLVAASSYDAGVAAAQVRTATVRVPTSAVPVGALTHSTDLAGKTVVPIGERSIVTSAMFSGTGAIQAPQGFSVIAIPLRSGQVIPPLHPGDRILVSLATTEHVGQASSQKSYHAMVLESPQDITDNSLNGGFGGDSKPRRLIVQTESKNAATICTHAAQGFVGIALLP